MQNYSEYSTCAKCGYGRRSEFEHIHSEYHAESNTVLRTCHRCKYKWHELPQDTPREPKKKRGGLPIPAWLGGGK